MQFGAPIIVCATLCAFFGLTVATPTPAEAHHGKDDEAIIEAYAGNTCNEASHQITHVNGGYACYHVGGALIQVIVKYVLRFSSRFLDLCFFFFNLVWVIKTDKKDWQSLQGKDLERQRLPWHA